MTTPTCIRTQWDKHLPHDFSSYPTTIIPLSFSQLHISLHSMDFQTSEETSIVPAEFPRGWLHISQPFFSKGKWTERYKKRKYWLGIPVALKARKIFNSLELSGTAIEIQVWCHSKVMSSATHNWKERVWRQAAVCKLVVPLEEPVLEEAPPFPEDVDKEKGSWAYSCPGDYF